MSEIEYINPDWPWVEDRGYTSIIRAGDFLWMAGQVALGPNGELIGKGDLMAQAHQIFKNIRDLLGLVGYDLSAVIRMTNYFALPLTQELAEDFWVLRREYFGGYKPASTGVHVASLMTPERLLEIDVIAYAPR